MNPDELDDGGPRPAEPVESPLPPESSAVAEDLPPLIIDEVPAEPVVAPSLEAALVEDLGPSPASTAAPDEDLPPPPDADDLPPDQLRGVIEALLLVATRPLSTERIAACLPGSDPVYLEGFLQGLADRWTHEHRGWELRREAKGWQIMTRPLFHPWVRQLEKRDLPTKLSKGALETLAVVAYKQPVARGVIEDIRGVQCGPVLRQLMDLKLVMVTGRDDSALGRPLLYGTTDQFLVRFGLGSPADLPKRHEFGA